MKKNSKTKQTVLLICLDKIVKMLHPFMPFITEEINSLLNPYFCRNGILTEQEYPTKKDISKMFNNSLNSLDSYDNEIDNYLKVCSVIRGIKSNFKIPQKLANGCKAYLGNLQISSQNEELSNFIINNKKYLIESSRINSISIDELNFEYFETSININDNEKIIIRFEINRYFDTSEKVNIMENKKKNIISVADTIISSGK